jgi:hypothetical protein
LAGTGGQLRYIAAAGLLACNAVVIAIGLPAFEELKPTRRLARLVAAAAAADDHIGTFRLNRCTSSWRSYVGRHSDATPRRRFCAMLRSD